MRFSDIVGQRELIYFFVKSSAGNHLSHAYIIEGDAGMGKKTLVDAIANYLLCPNSKDGQICGECADCVQFVSGNHPDVVYVKPSKKTGYGVDDIRKQVLDTVNIKPYQNQYKIYIIASADLVNPQAQNILLKTIEEPPKYALFFLTTENKQKLLETVLSRCSQLKVHPLSDEEMAEFAQKRGLAGVESFFSFAQGNAGRLVSLMQAEEFQIIKRDMENLLNNFINSSEHDIIEMIGILSEYEENLAEALNVLQILVRDRLKSSFEQRRFLDRMPTCSTAGQKKCYALALNIFNAKNQLASNVNKKLIIWNLFLI